MTVELQFHPLPQPVSAKALKAYHKDAGWSEPIRGPKTIDPRGRVQWVSVESHDKQIGIARLEMAAPEFCYVADLIVSSKFRRQGVGHWFLARIEQYCATFGIRRLLLEPRAGTESFYLTQSFAADPLVPNMLKKDVNPFLPKMFLPQRG